MKKLQKKYNKRLVQESRCGITLFNNKHEIYIWDNCIGFKFEVYRITEKEYKDNFCNYTHHVNIENHKLFKKYPDISKEFYKQWLKEYNEKLKSKL